MRTLILFVLALASLPLETLAAPKLIPQLKVTGRNFKIVFEQSPEVPTEERVPSVFANPIPKEEVVSCIESVCGKAEQNWGWLDVGIEASLNPSVSAKAVWAEKYQASLESSLETEQSINSALASLLRKTLQSDVKLESSTAAHVFTSMYATIAELTNERMQAVLVPSPSGLALNEAKFEEMLKEIPEPKKTAVRRLFTDFFIPMISSAIADAQSSNKLKSRLDSRFPGVAAMEALKKDATNLTAKKAALTKTVGLIASTLVDDYSSVVIAKALTGADLSKTESDEYAQFAVTIEIYSTLFGDGPLKNSLLAIPFDAVAAIKNIKEKSKALAMLEASESSDVEQTARDISTICSAKLALSKDLNTSGLRIRKLKEMIVEVKKAAKVVTGRYADDKHRTEALTSVDAIEFMFAPTDEENQQILVNAFQARSRELNSQLPLSTDTPEHRQFILNLALMLELGDDEKSDDPVRASAITKACENLPVNTISDYAISFMGKISLSWFTASYPEVGVSILAHEIGHVVSAKLRSQQLLSATLLSSANTRFAESRSCVTERNPYFSANPFARLGWISSSDSKWTEEDWADHFSAQVMNELERTKNPWYFAKNKGCALVSDTGDSYSDTTFDPAAGDSHSSGALRTLLIAHDRNQNTAQCKPVSDAITKAGKKLNCP